jgi:hypothetical protein
MESAGDETGTHVQVSDEPPKGEHLIDEWHGHVGEHRNGSGEG